MSVQNTWENKLWSDIFCYTAFQPLWTVHYWYLTEQTCPDDGYLQVYSKRWIKKEGTHNIKTTATDTLEPFAVALKFYE